MPKKTKVAQTVIIWDELNADLEYFVLDGDYTHLDRVYINQVTDEDSEKKADELNELLYNQEDGTFLHKSTQDFPYDAVLNGAKVIVAGFLP
jgi:hypothetical protein